MIANAFEYTAPQSLDEALGLIAGGAKPLSGGMSLIPMMKLRLAAPEHLVDLARLKELNYIREENGELHIGAAVTHYEVESSPLLLGKCPLLAETAAHIGDIQVRNMGTIGGSVAHADPASDYPQAAPGQYLRRTFSSTPSPPPSNPVRSSARSSSLSSPDSPAPVTRSANTRPAASRSWESPCAHVGRTAWLA